MMNRADIGKLALLGAVPGAALGGGAGALSDKEHRGRNALIGAGAGAAITGTVLPVLVIRAVQGIEKNFNRIIAGGIDAVGKGVAAGLKRKP